MSVTDSVVKWCEFALISKSHGVCSRMITHCLQGQLVDCLWEFPKCNVKRIFFAAVAVATNLDCSSQRVLGPGRGRLSRQTVVDDVSDNPRLLLCDGFVQRSFATIVKSRD